VYPETNIRGWHSHVDGAVALITSGRRRLFRSETSRELFLSIRELMVKAYLQRTELLLIFVSQLNTSEPQKPQRREYIGKHPKSLKIFGSYFISYRWIDRVPEDNLSQRYALLNLHLAELRADNNKITTLSPQLASNAEIVLEFLNRAEELEKQYRDWYENQAWPWAPTTVAWVDKDEGMDLATSGAFPGRVEEFPELTAGYRYNIARSSQILIWTSILRAVAWTGYPKDYRLTAIYAEARQRCIYLIEGIVASVPYFVGWKGSRNGALAGVAQSACGNNARAMGVSAFYLMWPMFVAANSDFATPEQRAFVRGKLIYIAENWASSKLTD
jgi:hypothetical protein